MNISTIFHLRILQNFRMKTTVSRIKIKREMYIKIIQNNLDTLFRNLAHKEQILCHIR